MLMELKRDTIVRRVDDVMSAEVDNELVMMRLESNGYFGLDTIGRRIWELMVEPRTVGQICDQLQEEYEVSAEVCERDLLHYLRELDGHGLLQGVA